MSTPRGKALRHEESSLSPTFLLPRIQNTTNKMERSIWIFTRYVNNVNLMPQYLKIRRWDARLHSCETGRKNGSRVHYILCVLVGEERCGVGAQSASTFYVLDSFENRKVKSKWLFRFIAVEVSERGHNLYGECFLCGSFNEIIPLKRNKRKTSKQCCHLDLDLRSSLRLGIVFIHLLYIFAC